MIQNEEESDSAPFVPSSMFGVHEWHQVHLGPLQSCVYFPTLSSVSFKKPTNPVYRGLSAQACVISAQCSVLLKQNTFKSDKDYGLLLTFLSSNPSNKKHQTTGFKSAFENSPCFWAEKHVHAPLCQQNERNAGLKTT